MTIVPYLLLAAAQVVHPAAEPQFSVEPSCRAATNLNLAVGQSYKECMQDELEAKNEVAKKWNSYREAARSRCSATVMIGGVPSYVELFECLEIDKAVSTMSNLGAADPLKISPKTTPQDEILQR